MVSSSTAWARASRIAAVLVIASVTLTMRARARDAPPASATPKAPLQVTIDKSKVDLVEHHLELRASRDLARVTIKVCIATIGSARRPSPGGCGKKGLMIPIAFEGFGETALLVKTADEVDEPRNRRVDYTLSVDDPMFKSSGFHPSWTRVL